MTLTDALQQAEATANSHRAQLREVQLQTKNLQTELNIVQKKLNLAKLELSRIQSLVKKNKLCLQVLRL
jgi:multidrug resistance efflux pump